MAVWRKGDIKVYLSIFIVENNHFRAGISDVVNIMNRAVIRPLSSIEAFSGKSKNNLLLR